MSESASQLTRRKYRVGPRGAPLRMAGRTGREIWRMWRVSFWMVRDPCPPTAQMPPTRTGPNERVLAQPVKINESETKSPGRTSAEKTHGSLPSVLFGMCGGGTGGEKNWKLCVLRAAEGLAAEHGDDGVRHRRSRDSVGELVPQCGVRLAGSRNRTYRCWRRVWGARICK